MMNYNFDELNQRLNQRMDLLFCSNCNCSISPDEYQRINTPNYEQICANVEIIRNTPKTNPKPVKSKCRTPFKIASNQLFIIFVLFIVLIYFY